MNIPTQPPSWQPPGWQPLPPQPPPRKSWPARHKVWTTVFAVVGALVVLGDHRCGARVGQRQVGQWDHSGSQHDSSRSIRDLRSA